MARIHRTIDSQRERLLTHQNHMLGKALFVLAWTCLLGSGLVERPEASAGRGVLESARAALLREVHEVMLRAAATRTPPLDARG